jgi:hypothetical protein
MTVVHSILDHLVPGLTTWAAGIALAHLRLIRTSQPDHPRASPDRRGAQDRAAAVIRWLTDWLA